MEKNIDVSNDEIFSQQERENILEKVKKFYENKLAEKDRKINLLLTANKKITYSSKTRQYSQLKKSDITLHYIECSQCESEEFCDDNNLFKVVNEFEHDENCLDYGNDINLDIRCIVKYKKYESLEE